MLCKSCWINRVQRSQANMEWTKLFWCRRLQFFQNPKLSLFLVVYYSLSWLKIKWWILCVYKQQLQKQDEVAPTDPYTADHLQRANWQYQRVGRLSLYGWLRHAHGVRTLYISFSCCAREDITYVDMHAVTYMQCMSSHSPPTWRTIVQQKSNQRIK